MCVYITTIVTLFTAPPVIMVGNGTMKVAAQLLSRSSFAVMIYSTSPVTVVMAQLQSTNINAADVNNAVLTYSSIITSTRVQLEVLNNTVDADGFVARIEFTVNAMEQFGEYYLSVNNSVGTTKQILEIFPEGE